MKRKIALLICSRTLGGHEQQAAELAADLTRTFTVKVFVNQAEHAQLFSSLGLEVEVRKGELLVPGNLITQLARGLFQQKRGLAFLDDYESVMVCAGAIEASVAVGIALRGAKRLSLYLPCFFDRTAVWNRLPGHAYNLVLGRFLNLYGCIITVNRIQAALLKRHTDTRIIVIRNKIRKARAYNVVEQPRLVFVGRLDAPKRVAELLHWLDTGDNPFPTLLIIGDGPLRPGLEQVAASLQHLKVEFHGWLSPVEQDELLAPDDILMLNSAIEGEPMVVREAHQRGMRVLARDIDGVRGVTRKQMRFVDRASLVVLLGRVHAASNSATRDKWHDDEQQRQASSRLAAIARHAPSL